MTEPIDHSRLTGAGLCNTEESFVDRVRHMILSGRFQPEEHLQEVEVAKLLGVSRTPVREAFISLKKEGLLTHIFNRGYFVKRFTFKEIQDAYEVRANLEGLACRIVAERGLDQKTRDELQRELDEGDRLLSVGRLTAEAFIPYRDMNERFHQRLLTTSGNDCLADAIARAMSVPFSSSRVVHWIDFEKLRQSHQHHHQIFQAITSGQAHRAQALMMEHIYQSADTIKVSYPGLESA